ncbi:MAG: hypothetical protein JXA60_08725 [Candidatus Coatesbacteria bacterium]|nr:hypothetical protein [Candidatus Coatesbacteria bacterium]
MRLIFLLIFVISSIISAAIPFGFYTCKQIVDGKEDKSQTQYLTLRQDNCYIYTNLRGGFSAGYYKYEGNIIVFEDGVDIRKFRYFMKGNFLTLIAIESGKASKIGHLSGLLPTKIGSSATYNISNIEPAGNLKYPSLRKGKYEYWDSNKKQVHVFQLIDNMKFIYINPFKKQIEGTYTYSGNTITLTSNSPDKAMRVFNVIRIGNNLILLRSNKDTAKGKSPLNDMKPLELRGAVYEPED